MNTLRVIASASLPLDVTAFETIIDDAVESHGWTYTLERPLDVLGALESASGPTLVLPGEDLEIAAESLPSPLVRYDLGARDLDANPALLHHLRGIGLDGLPWAVAAVISAARHPAERIAYGDHREQWGEWREPLDGRAPRAVAILLHGGYYRSRWQAGLMDELAIDLAERGWAAWNVEYRRPDRHGWEATQDDLHAAVAALADIPAAVGLPIVIFGHSAGGQLSLQLGEWMHSASGIPTPALAVSLAGVVDLERAQQRHLGEGAVAMALGGTREQVPDRYLSASPALFTEHAVEWLLVQGSEDSMDLVEMNRRLAASVALGTPELIEEPGHHFSVIDPRTPIWASAMERVESHLAAQTERQA
jgi:acetyl esterase/lipase